MSLRAGSVQELLVTWLPQQRWFAARDGGAVTVRAAGLLDLAPGVEVRLVVAESASGAVATYQLPLTLHPGEQEGLDHALIGVVATDGEPEQWVYDGPHDRRFVSAWLDLVATDGELSGDGEHPARVRGVRPSGTPPPDVHRGSRVMSGEQSNTSVIVGADGPDPVILKVFRVIQAGLNPDVSVTAMLTAAGCRQVPQLVGWVEGEWTGLDGLPVSGHLTSVSEFLAGGEDAWRIACVAVQEGRSFDDESYAIGAATATVHRTLAETLPTFPTTPAVLAALADHLQQRIEWAAAATDGVRPYLEAASGVAAAVRSLDSAPDRQRIHGDFHLGQVLHAGERGWVILDFEGEPLRPLIERNEPDLAVRDIAGMLRSFDYAARHNVIGVAEDDPRSLSAAEWARSCQDAFLAGYASVTGRDPEQDAVLQRSFELDKALYEVVYETRHRPDWVDLPLHAVARLLSAPT